MQAYGEFLPGYMMGGRLTKSCQTVHSVSSGLGYFSEQLFYGTAFIVAFMQTLGMAVKETIPSRTKFN